jgi:threonine dehydratase
VTPDPEGLITSAAVSIDEIRIAAHGLHGVALRTSLVPAPGLSELVGHSVYLKLESKQPTGAFKLRGAWNAVSQLSDDERARGVITYSSGNHGQAVAFAAQRLGIRAVIVMPETVPEAKLEGVKRWGGEIVLAGKTSEDRFAKAQEIVVAEGLTVIPPFDHPHIIAGQGTVGLEIVEDLPDVAGVAVPVGGGGLCAGVTTAIHALCPGSHVWAVEPVGSSAYGAAVQAGRPVRLDAVASVADGLLPLSVGTLTFQHMYPRAQSVTVTDADIVAATRWLRDELDIIAEPSGAATTAALRSGAILPDGPTVLVVSGGNIRPESIDRLAPGG